MHILLQTRWSASQWFPPFFVKNYAGLGNDNFFFFFFFREREIQELRRIRTGHFEDGRTTLAHWERVSFFFIFYFFGTQYLPDKPDLVPKRTKGQMDKKKRQKETGCGV